MSDRDWFCIHPGCNRVVEGLSLYCAAHQPDTGKKGVDCFELLKSALALALLIFLIWILGKAGAPW